MKLSKEENHKTYQEYTVFLGVRLNIPLFDRSHFPHTCVPQRPILAAGRRISKHADRLIEIMKSKA